MFDRLRFLEFGHHGGAAGHQLLELGNVVGVLHEGQRHPVDAERQAEREVLVILRCHGRHRKDEVGQVDTLAVADGAGDLDLGVDGPGGVTHDAQAHLAVVDQQQSTRLRGLEDFRMKQRDALGRAGGRVHVEAELLALLQLHRSLGEGAEAQLGALEVHQDGDRVLVFFFQCTELRDPLAMILMLAVAEVQAKDVGARLEQGAQTLGGCRGRAQRCHDLGEAVALHWTSLLPG